MNCAIERPRAAASWPLLVLLLVAASGCARRSGEPSGGAAASPDSAAAEPAAEKSVRIEAAAVRRGELVVPIHADGAIRTPRAVDLRAKVPGELREVRVRDGDRVQAGQLLARIDPREYELALDEAQQRHLQALAQIAAEDDSLVVDPEALASFERESARLDAELRAGRLDPGAHTARLLQADLAALRGGAFRREAFEQRTGLAAARVARERARLNLEHTELRAPFAGVVHGVAAVAGETVSSGATLCSLYDNERLEAVVHVLEADLGDLETGRPALLAVPATGDTLWARVDALSPRLDETSRTCEAVLRFPNPAGRLRPGMFVRAEIAGWIHPDLLLAPKAALLVRDERPLVFKVDPDGRAQWLYVDLGRQNDRWVEITGVHSGGELLAGDLVVVSNHLTLAHQAKLEIQEIVAVRDRWAAGEPPAAARTAADSGAEPAP